MNSLRKFAAWAGASVVLAAPAAAASPGEVERHWREEVRTLSSDAFEGRFPGSAGEEKTLDYLTRSFAAAGLRPGGEPVRGRRTWFQSVPVAQTMPPAVRKLEVTGTGAPGAIGPEGGLLVTGTQASGAHVEFAAVPLVFVGYGIEAPQSGWDDYKGADLRGGIAVVLFGDPVRADGNRVVPGKTLSTAGAPRIKTAAALRHGASGVIFIHEAAVLGYGWDTIAGVLRTARLALATPEAAAITPRLSGWLREDTAGQLLGAMGLDLARAKALAGQDDFRPKTMGDLSLSASLDVEQRRLTSRTVIGLLPGTSHPGETVIVGAHWDHQGTGAPDAAGRHIYNGALDNASGVATVVEIARTLARRGAAQRNIAFVAWTLEEPGILGSEYYADHPVYPLATTVAAINFDTMMPFGPAHDFSQNADPASELTDLLAEVGARRGRRLTLEPHPEMFLRPRSDHAPLARRGVPVLFYRAGEDLIEGGRAPARAFEREYFANRYHRYADRYDPAWNVAGIVEDVALLSDFAWGLANTRAWPAWKPGAEFGAVRDASAAARR